MTTFRAARLEVLADTLLDVDNHAQRGTYTPAGGTPRPITVHAGTDGDLQMVDYDASGTKIDRLVVLASRDSTLTNSDGDDIGGIETPEIGDTYLPPESYDPIQKPYTYQGEIRESSDIKWRLVFERRRESTRGVQ